MTLSAVRRLYGRRQGHKLSARQQDLVDRLLPEREVRITEDDVQLPVGLGGKSSLWLEIGFGGGEHLAAVAAAHPDVGFIGCEPFLNGVAKVLTQIEERNLTNIAVHMGDARDLLERLPDGALGRIFLLFPDPWPKARHHKRRFVNAETVRQMARLLAPGGRLRIVSDKGDYIRWSLAHLRRNPDFKWLAERADDWRRRPPDWTPTRYEQKALAAGGRCTYLEFERRAPFRG